MNLPDPGCMSPVHVLRISSISNENDFRSWSLLLNITPHLRRFAVHARLMFKEVRKIWWLCRQCGVEHKIFGANLRVRHGALHATSKYRCSQSELLSIPQTVKSVELDLKTLMARTFRKRGSNLSYVRVRFGLHSTVIISDANFAARDQRKDDLSKRLARKSNICAPHNLFFLYRSHTTRLARCKCVCACETTIILQN